MWWPNSSFEDLIHHVWRRFYPHVIIYKGPIPPKIVFCISLKKVVFWCSESVFCIMIQKVSILVYCFHWNLSLWNQSLPVYCKMKSVFCILDGYFWVQWRSEIEYFGMTDPPVQGSFINWGGYWRLLPFSWDVSVTDQRKMPQKVLFQQSLTASAGLLLQKKKKKKMTLNMVRPAAVLTGPILQLHLQKAEGFNLSDMEP